MRPVDDPPIALAGHPDRATAPGSAPERFADPTAWVAQNVQARQECGHKVPWTEGVVITHASTRRTWWCGGASRSLVQPDSVQCRLGCACAAPRWRPACLRGLVPPSSAAAQIARIRRQRSHDTPGGANAPFGCRLSRDVTGEKQSQTPRCCETYATTTNPQYNLFRITPDTARRRRLRLGDHRAPPGLDIATPMLEAMEDHMFGKSVVTDML